ncbi:MAG: Tad domain-containing protein [Actinobacteria bacterium]|nr:Tad domain-containing protein [Actinomycetota bacterium]
MRTRLQNEDGSISVLVFGLFAVVLLSGVVLTDISAVIVAQRSLVQATESAAQSAAHALDLDTYYQGKHSALSFLVSDASPVIPIDCKAASSRASETLAEIANTANRNYGDTSFQFGRSNRQLVRRELSDVRISEFQCNGTEVLITASAKAWLPISLSLFSFESVDLSASAGTTSVKKRVLSLFGLNF